MLLGHKAFSFDCNFFKLAGLKVRHKILDKFELWPYCTICLSYFSLSATKAHI